MGQRADSVCADRPLDAITEHGMDGENVSLPYSVWQLSSASLAPAVAFGKCVGGGQE